MLSLTICAIELAERLYNSGFKAIVKEDASVDRQTTINSNEIPAKQIVFPSKCKHTSFS